jgi:signal recognition particle subunit SRP54
VVILDTAGRLQIDEERMQEAQRIYERLHPQETLLVLDAMTGQEAVKVAQEFHRRVQVTGLILTRMDSDARGGAALSIRAVTGIPVKFLGTSERPDGLEPFYPDRLASRILGMGDVLTLIERTQETISQEQAKEVEKKLRTATFNFEDFYNQLQSMKRMGPLSQLLGMIPGFGSLVRNEEVVNALDGKEVKRMEAIILSMTREERRYPDVIDSSRRRRIARGSGTSLQEVGQLIKQFDEMRRLMKELTNGRVPRGLSSLLGPMASAEMGAAVSSHRSSPKHIHREKPRSTPHRPQGRTKKRRH